MRYWRLSQRLEKLEKDTMIDDNGILFILENPDGTYGEAKMTKEELNEYIVDNKYSHVMIDDISLKPTKTIKYQRKGDSHGKGIKH